MDQQIDVLSCARQYIQEVTGKHDTDKGVESLVAGSTNLSSREEIPRAWEEPSQ